MCSDDYRSICSRKTLQNKSEGCFLPVVESFLSEVNLQEFASCETDLARIEFCTQFWPVIGVELIFRSKDTSAGNQFKIDGNAAFEKGQFQDALLLYSKSIMRTPVGPSLASVLANRSALLCRLKRYQSAIEDVKLALSYEYPEDKRSKLYERMATAYLHLKNYKHAQIALGIADNFAAKYSEADVDLKESLKKLRTKIESTVTAGIQAVSQNNTDVEMMLENSKFPGATSKFGVSSSISDGRFGIALEEISVGETILAETPFASCLVPERNGTHCHHCLNRLTVSIPCETCAYVAFCSIKCRDSSTSYHQFECKVSLLLVGSGMSVLPLLALRIVTQTSVETLIEELNSLESQKPNEIFFKNGIYGSKTYNALINLVAHESVRAPEDFFQRTIMALFLLKSLRASGYFKINIFTSPNPTPTELRVGAFILRNLQVLQFNAYEIVETLLPPNSSCEKIKVIPIGLGIYTTAAFLNHSCAPNVVRHFNGTTLYVNATQTVKSGEAICDSYGPTYAKFRFEDRQRILIGRYWFTCECIACKQQWSKASEVSTDLAPAVTTGLEMLEHGKVSEGKEILIKYLKNVEFDGKLPKREILMAEEALRLAFVAVAEPCPK